MLEAVKSNIIHGFRLTKDATKDWREHARSSHWATFEKHWLRDHPTCIACGGTERLVGHHIVPFAEDPSKELDPLNVVTLCMAKDRHCHLLIAHCNNFRTMNPNVIADSLEIFSLYQAKDYDSIQRVLSLLKHKGVPIHA